MYSPACSGDQQPLKATFLLYLKLTRYIALREELLGERLRADPELADFLTDILKATYFGPYGLKKQLRSRYIYDEVEYMAEECTTCQQAIEVVAEFGDTTRGREQHAWCRKCKPLGEENVMELLGVDKWLGW